MNTVSADKKGFTLVEVIIVMAVMSIVMMAVMSLVIPVQRSAVVQSQVADIQGGMRVALDSMAKDFRNAGFLVDGAPISPTTGPTTSITIQTRAGAVGIVSPDGIPDNVTDPFVFSDVEQKRHFPEGSYVGVFSPMLRNQYVGTAVYRVNSQTSDGVVLTNADGTALASTNPFKSDGKTALIFVPLANAAVTPANTIKAITYTFDTETINGKTVNFLRRTENGSSRSLARGVDGTFEPKESTMADGNPVVNRVIVRMSGETVEMSKDAIGSQKTRTLDTVFTLRNI